MVLLWIAMAGGLSDVEHHLYRELRKCTSVSEPIPTESKRTNLNHFNHGNGDRNELEKFCSGNL